MLAVRMQREPVLARIRSNDPGITIMAIRTFFVDYLPLRLRRRRSSR
jgi:hypothetical protein